MNPSYFLALDDVKRLMEQQFEPAPRLRSERPARTRRVWRAWLAQPARRLRPQPTA